MNPTKIVNIKKMEQPDSDVDYWVSQPAEKRLEALELIRSEYINWKYHARPEFQRVYRIIKL